MGFYIFKLIFTASLIVCISEIAKLSDKLGGLIAALPLTTLLVISWMYIDGVPDQKISNHMASDLMVFEAHPKDLPAWAYDSVLPRLNYQTCQMISKCCQALTDDILLSDHAIIARVLIIHFWRRLVLRYPTVEAPLSASQWPFAKVHRNIAAVYPLLLEASKTTNGAEKRFR